jgi:hypothetical protein
MAKRFFEPSGDARSPPLIGPAQQISTACSVQGNSTRSGQKKAVQHMAERL